MMMLPVPRHNRHRNQNLVHDVLVAAGRIVVVKEVSAMVFKGTVLPVGELIERAKRAPAPDWTTIATDQMVRRRAAEAARYCAQLLATGAPLSQAWRFGILQTLDDYTATSHKGGTALGRQVFDPEPARTGSPGLDAAFAALAVWLADRDGWAPPAWALDPSRRAPAPWYPAETRHPGLIAEAEREVPREFRERNVIVAAHDLDRA